jgi:UDP-glucose 4-epimerase
MTQNPSRVLLTGGAGYIGSHTYVALHEAGLEPVILDNFSNSDPAVLKRLERLTGKAVLCERGDVTDTEFVKHVLRMYGCQSAVHFAGLKAVGESVAEPLRYFRTNVGGLISLLDAMQAGTSRAIVFSSSATVYGEPDEVPIQESSPCVPESPYAYTKLMSEQVLSTLKASDQSWRVGVLRYFNPVGAHPSGLIGEDPSGIPNNLMPYVTQVAVGKRKRLNVFGNDYPTPDGTGVRDYLHVCDLAEGHVAAVRALLARPQSFTVNLGTGEGTSVLGVVRAFERASGRAVPFEFAPRRAGDVPAYFADVSLAGSVLGWRASRSMDDMCRDAWRWQSSNPNGYRTLDIASDQAMETGGILGRPKGAPLFAAATPAVARPREVEAGL